MKYLSVATLVAFSCLLFSACSEEPDLSVYTNKISELQSQLDSLKAGSGAANGFGGGSSITMSSGLEGAKDELQVELGKMQELLEKVKEEHKKAIKIKEDDIKALDLEIEKLAESNSDAKDILDKRHELEAKRKEQQAELTKHKADLKAQEDKLQAEIDSWNKEFTKNAEEYYSKEARVAELKEAIKREENKRKIVIDFKMPYVGIERINEGAGEGFKEYTVYYDNSTEVKFKEYEDGTFEEEGLMYNLAFGNGIEWVRHHTVRHTNGLLEYELMEYLDKNKAIYQGSNKAFYASMKKVDFNRVAIEDDKGNITEATPNNSKVLGTPDNLIYNIYKGGANGNVQNISSLVVDITLRKNASGIWEKVVREAFFKYSGESMIEDKSYGNGQCSEYSVTLSNATINSIPLWNASNLPCYYK